MSKYRSLQARDEKFLELQGLAEEISEALCRAREDSFEGNLKVLEKVREPLAQLFYGHQELRKACLTLAGRDEESA